MFKIIILATTSVLAKPWQLPAPPPPNLPPAAWERRFLHFRLVLGISPQSVEDVLHRRLFRTAAPAVVAGVWRGPPQGPSPPCLRCGFLSSPAPPPAGPHRVRAACRKGHYRSQGSATTMGSWWLAAGKGHRVNLSPWEPHPHPATMWAQNLLVPSLVIQ